MAETRDRKIDMVPAIDSGSGLVYVCTTRNGRGKEGDMRVRRKRNRKKLDGGRKKKVEGCIFSVLVSMSTGWDI